MATFPERVFSGVQPTGNLHLGNYLGALKRFVAMQATHPCLYCVVDLHAMTLPHEPKQLARTTREVTAAFLACGIDPKANIVFNQSRVAEHAELTWIFDCVARLGWLNRMTQFKEKAGKDRENASIGLYNYPVLMAADILRVPGDPCAGRRRPEAASRTHPRHRAEVQQRLRRIYRRPRLWRRLLSAARTADPGPGDAGDEPARRHEENVEVRSVRKFAHIALTDDADTIALKIRKAKTDPEPLPSEVEGLTGRPEADNLVGIFAALADETKADVLKRFAGGQFSAFKTALADLTIEKLAPIRAEMLRLSADDAFVDSVLADGAERARKWRGRTWTLSRTSSALSTRPLLPGSLSAGRGGRHAPTGRHG